ncbi:MAG: response regulator [Daejeonella sp.]
MAKKILVIDDDKDILAILNIIFKDEGYEVILCDTGTTPEYVQLIHPDLVLLDIKIVGAEKTGAEICKDLKSNSETKRLPVILLSAELDLDILAVESRADAYISKPFEAHRLINRVKEFLN